MAKPVNQWFANGKICGALLCILLSVSDAYADVITDPTRPPGALDVDGAAVNAGPVLQSILIGAGRKEAIISGRTVKVGDRFGDARIVKISDTEVVLTNGSDLQTLKLFPTLEKRMSSGHSSGMSARLHGQEN